MINKSKKLSPKVFYISSAGFLTLLILFSFASAKAPKFQLKGEFGLWVKQQQNQITVHWITAENDSGFLKVYNHNTLVFEEETPPAYGHRASFTTGAREVLLQYGGLNNHEDIHETEVFLDHENDKIDHKFTKVDSIFVLGDIHGEFDTLTTLLMNAKLIDSQLNWRGSKRHLMALGDIFDRGHDVTRTLWFLYKLEKQAKAQGGRVHILLGNHEIMTFGNDLRYLSNKEKLIASTHKVNYAEMYHPHNSILGKWLAQKPGIVKVDKALFAHGGVTLPYTALTISAVNDSVRKFLNEEVFFSLLADSIPTTIDSVTFYRRLAFFYAGDSIFWHRGYVMSDTLKRDLQQVLKTFDAKVHVIAHTPVESIRSFYDGKVIAVDLREPVTEMLLLTRKGKHKRFRVTMQGAFEPL